jgi:glycosyltransferase involved in cell wall biosynthesis
MNNKIKILICSVSLEDKGGVSNYVRLILENYPDDRYLIEHFAQGNTSKFKKGFYPIIILIQLLKFKEKLKKFHPDIIHINPSLAWVAIIRDYIFLRYAKQNGFSVLFCLGGWDISISGHFHKKNVIHKFFYKIFQMPDRILVLAKSFKNELIELGINPGKLIVTTMMVESEKFKSNNRTFDPPYTLLFCSRIEKLKGVFQLLDAFKLVKQKYPETKLIYVGNGSELENLNKKIYDMKLEENVKCVGYKSGAEKINYFRSSDIVILPSFTEGFPNIYCEALAAGLPFIGTNVGGLVDVLEDGKEGLIIKSIPPSPEEIFKKILQLIENKELMIQISKNNVLEAKNKYDVKVVISKLDNIYQDIYHVKEKKE